MKKSRERPRSRSGAPRRAGREPGRRAESPPGPESGRQPRAPRPAGGALLSPAAATALSIGLLAALLVALHGAALRLPFIADDYIFLEQTRRGLIGSLARAFLEVPTYFRPVGREIHFYMLALAAGERPLAFHLASLALLLVILGLIVILGRRHWGLRTGLIAGGVYALFYPHRVQLGYASCAQDLLACAIAVGAALLYLRGRAWAAAAAYFAALLAKESVAPLPLILAAWEAWTPRVPGAPRVAARIARTRPLWIAAAAWAVLVPGLRSVLAEPGAAGGMLPTSGLPIGSASVLEGFRLAMLSFVALEQPWRDLIAGFGRLGGAASWIAAALAALAGWVAFAGRDGQAPAVERAGAWRLGLPWAVFGAIPVALVGARFSAYYASFAAIGFALLVGWGLARLRVLAVAPALALAALMNLAANGTDRIRLHRTTEAHRPGSRSPPTRGSAGKPST